MKKVNFSLDFTHFLKHPCISMVIIRQTMEIEMPMMEI